MISRADFPNLFPWIFTPETSPARNRGATSPTPAAIARWEDDGGRTRKASLAGEQLGPGAEPSPRLETEQKFSIETQS
jgi:hypothetical protein